ITPKKIVHLKETTSKSVGTPKPEIKVLQIVLWYLDFGCSKHMTGNRSQLMNFRSKDEASDDIIKCIKNIQVRLNATVRNIITNNGTEFFNQTLRDFYENVGISHQTSVAHTPQQNGVVER
nr:retrotransposon protein, putative, Ty1-copia subclass [Tanacetum cinerariifolium]